MSIENEYSMWLVVLVPHTLLCTYFREIPDDKAKEIQYVDQVLKCVAEIPEAK